GYAPLTHIEDPFGNRIDYFWSVATGAALRWSLDRIEYTSNPPAGLAAFARVKFTWSAEATCPGAGLPKGARMSFLSSTRVRWEGSRGLQRIETEVRVGSGGTFRPVRKVELGYSTEAPVCDGGHGTPRLLTSIQETATSPEGVATTRP